MENTNITLIMWYGDFQLTRGSLKLYSEAQKGIRTCIYDLR